MTRFSTKQIAATVFGAIAAGFLLFWFFGGICWRYESYEVQQESVFSGSRYGVSLGPKQFYLRKGQTLALSYSAKIKHGSVDFFFAKPFKSALNTKGGKMDRVTASGSGEFRYPIPESGFYRISTWTMLDRGKTDLSYTAHWTARN